jgi:hypothetical protein
MSIMTPLGGLPQYNTWYNTYGVKTCQYGQLSTGFFELSANKKTAEYVDFNGFPMVEHTGVEPATS